MKKKITIVALFVSALSMAQELSFTVRVYEQDGKLAISNAPVCITLRKSSYTWKGDLPPDKIEKRTDETGSLLCAVDSNCGEASVRVCGLDGYYDSALVKIKGDVANGTGILRGAITPKWTLSNDVVRVAMRRIGSPVSLFVKRECLELEKDMLDVCEGKFNYDLMMGDWLPPIGKGKIADIEFIRLPHEDFGDKSGCGGLVGRAGRDMVLMRFVGEGNGLIEHVSDPSETLRIRTAPEEGYIAEHSIWDMIDENLRWRRRDDKNMSIAFRIRTLRDGSGKIVSAYYGKIYGNPKLISLARIVKGIDFCYYLNPRALDRNLEWNRRENLCTSPGKLRSLWP